jgi:translation initiation factor IF-3
VNRQIRVPEVRVIDHDGQQLGLFQTTDAMRRAEEFGLDLVEIAPTERPPVCKIMDFGKFKYEQSKKKQTARKQSASTQLKEVKMRPSTGVHDLDTKFRRAKEFLTHGHKVKMTVQFRGREMVHQDRGKVLIQRAIADMEEFGYPEQPPRLEGRVLSVVLVPITIGKGGKELRGQKKEGSHAKA